MKAVGFPHRGKARGGKPSDGSKGATLKFVSAEKPSSLKQAASRLHCENTDLRLGHRERRSLFYNMGE